eukprot:11356355-Prorocentrum_lima.AAC.1
MPKSRHAPIGCAMVVDPAAWSRCLVQPSSRLSKQPPTSLSAPSAWHFSSAPPPAPPARMRRPWEALQYAMNE